MASPDSPAPSAPPPRKRSAPQVLESKTFKDGAIYLYRRADYKKPTWFIRVKVPGAQGYVWKSSKTTDEHAAYRVAEDLFNHSLVKVLSGGKLRSKRINDALKAYADALEPQRSQLSVHYKILLSQRLLPIFQGKTFEDLDTALISKMVDALAAKSKRARLSPNTIKRLFADFRHFLHWSVENGYVDALPRFPKVSMEQNRRPHFDPRDWAKLTRFMRSWVKSNHPAVERDRTLLASYILILANTGIRVGEARSLRWRDIRPVRSSDEVERENVVLMVKGKTGMREVVARTPDVKRFFERVLELRRKDLTNKKSDIFGRKDVPLESYVFCASDGQPIGSFKKSFGTLLRDAGVETDTYGNKRSIYSLRHTYATFRLQEGVNQFILARNMGTSVAMLENFYGHTSNVAAADELTKTRAQRPKRKTDQPASPFDWLKA